MKRNAKILGTATVIALLAIPVAQSSDWMLPALFHEARPHHGDRAGHVEEVAARLGRSADCEGVESALGHEFIKVLFHYVLLCRVAQIYTRFTIPTELRVVNKVLRPLETNPGSRS